MTLSGRGLIKTHYTGAVRRCAGARGLGPARGGRPGPRPVFWYLNAELDRSTRTVDQRIDGERFAPARQIMQIFQNVATFLILLCWKGDYY